VGFVRADPGLDSLREGLRYWRTYGATIHLFGLAFLPVFAVLFLTGRADVFAATTTAWSDGLWAHWLGIPGWVWTATLVAGRLLNVAFAVGCVYVVYRIGTVMGGRPTGRLATLLLSLTWGFLVLAHEVGEDVPALFFLLLAVYGALQDGEEVLAPPGRHRRPKTLPLTIPRYWLAAQLSMTPETLSRLLAKLRDRGIMQVDRRHLAIIDEERLRHCLMEGDT
jgi:dolichyl-phosphate-mannose--protein O-mannosyl transferase